jgi:energy-coupling factor transporter ATP-binding protein EcfA2
MIKREFSQFLQTLNNASVSSNVRKIANLVNANLDVLLPLTTRQGQRIKKVVELAQANWSKITSDIQPLEQQAMEKACPFYQIKSLSVGPFRGFSKNEIFDLSSELVLIYGPNGTGKSSFCEALEFGLLGSVVDAENKRFRNQEDYLRNAHTNSLRRPVVVGLDKQGNDVPIASNETLYRFCFIEKNRIDSFARIAAQAPAKQTELISTLFGLEAFLEFARNFTESMDGRYLDITGGKAKELNQKRQVLAGFQQQLSTTMPEELKSVDTAEAELAQRYRNGISFAQMESELNGAGETLGLIQQLDEELQKPFPTKSNLSHVVLQEYKEAIDRSITECNIKQQELASLSQQVSFKQLYEAVTQVQASSPAACPACKTPLAQVQVNPYTHANTELDKLQYLAGLQQAASTLTANIRNLIRHVTQIIRTCNGYFTQNNPLAVLQLEASEINHQAFWNSLQNKAGDDQTFWQYVEVQVASLEKTDKEISQAEIIRIGKQTKLKKLREFSESILKLKTRRETALATIEKAKKAIAQFDTENAQLIADVTAEKPVVEENLLIAIAYDSFVQRLNSYVNTLPAQLVENLGEMVVTLYNAFNRNDGIHEQLSDVRLPLSQNERLQIAYKHSPKILFDALHVLSEGHIRCIGLAILAAKNIKENCSILIFDDPVNAIDDEHRESIRRTLFEDNFFRTKQIILACHGEEFFKDIQNLLPTQKAQEVKTLSFLPRAGDFSIIVDHNCTPRNYLIAARTHYAKGEIRDTLGKSRQALETLTKSKVWRYVNRHGDGNLSIKMRSATAPIELRNLTEQLRSKLAKTDFSDATKDAILGPIDTLLGISGESREWRYLNGGIHEDADRTEFDRSTVNDILTALETIDKALA